jgi:hypothetical protein
MSTTSSRPPSGVPTSNNTKYAVIVLLLVCGIGAALWLLRKPAEAPVPVALAPLASSVPPPAPTNPKLDDIPPPPPPEESAEEAKPAPRAVAIQSGGCEGRCRGAGTPELEQAIRIRANQARRCYNQALAQDSQLKGHVSLAVRIGPGGNLCSANVESNDMGTPAVANCAANIFRSAGGFPAPHGGCMDVNVPLAFVQQQH